MKSNKLLVNVVIAAFVLPVMAQGAPAAAPAAAPAMLARKGYKKHGKKKSHNITATLANKGA